MEDKRVNEKVLARIGLSSKKMKIARVMYNLKTAGGENSSTRKFEKALSSKTRFRARQEILQKVEEYFSNRAGD